MGFRLDCPLTENSGSSSAQILADRQLAHLLRQSKESLDSGWTLMGLYARDLAALQVGLE